ncbi:hypothetical protein ACFOEE_06405 [Pseudoalteromonas fenneropenaei]|uniref:Uncharacterized protein n=1 Tax=Pseudoalteromonas fenneropenaei TaxID=1737459 RepID=A0ABV7CHJ0_9GAMM
MSVVHNIKVPVAHAELGCALNLQLPSLSGQAPCLLPFGLALTEQDSTPAAQADIPEFVTVKPLVFKEATFSQDKAGDPEFVALFKGKDRLLEGEALGYYYLYINGYLWREIAVLPHGALSEVDLRKHHGNDFRPYDTYHAFEITLPVKSKGLLTDNTATEFNDVQIAFSRLQWSWEYINALGGMWPKDPRFDINPAKSTCPNKENAATYRNERMQTLAMQDAPNWQSIEHMGTITLPPLNTPMPCVYIHDVIGIAQDVKLDADTAMIELQLHQNSLQANGFYKSAMLAYKLFLNEELWETEQNFYVTSGVGLAHGGSLVRHGTTYKKNDAGSQQARKAASSLDRKKLQDYLIGEEPEAVIAKLERYIESKTTLLGLYQNPELNWHALYRDFSTLNAFAYPLAFEFAYEQLLCLIRESSTVPIYIPALQDKQTKLTLSRALKESAADCHAYIDELCTDEEGWLQQQFCASPDLFGDKLTATEPDKQHIREELGAFNPLKLALDTSQVQHQTVALPALFAEARFNQVIEKGLSESLAFWERQFKLMSLRGQKNRDLALFYTQVGSLAKSFGHPVLKDIQLHPLGEVPPDRFAISAGFDFNPLLQKVTSKKGRQAIKNALKAIKQGKQVNSNQLITIARELQRNINPTGAAELANLNGQPYLARHVRDEILQLLQQVEDLHGTFKRTAELKGMVFTANIKDVPPKILYDHALENGIDPKTLSMTAMQKHPFELKRAVSVPLMLLTGMTAYYTYSQYEKEFGGKHFTYQMFKHISTLGGTLAAIGLVWENYSKAANQHWLTQARATKLAEDWSKELRRPVKFTHLRTFGGAMGFISAGVQVWDGVELWRKQDKDAAAVTIIAGVLGGASAIYGAVLVSLGPIGWSLFLGSIVLSILGAYLVDTESEKWCKWGPFAKSLLGTFNSDDQADFNQFANPDVYYRYMFGTLLAPRVTVTKAVSQYLVQVDMPTFTPGVSELELNFSYKLSRLYDKPTAVEGWQTRGISGDKEYQLTMTPEGQGVALYTINIDSKQLFLSVITDHKASVKLRLDKDISLPVDHAALEKAI